MSCRNHPVRGQLDVPQIQHIGAQQVGHCLCNGHTPGSRRIEQGKR